MKTLILALGLFSLEALAGQVTIKCGSNSATPSGNLPVISEISYELTPSTDVEYRFVSGYRPTGMEFDEAIERMGLMAESVSFDGRDFIGVVENREVMRLRLGKALYNNEDVRSAKLTMNFGTGRPLRMEMTCFILR